MNGEREKEIRYELMMGQLILIVIVGILLSITAGFFIGKEVGLTKGISASIIEKPAYCTVDKQSDVVEVKCNELTNVSMDSLCEWISPELKDKIKIVVIN